MTISRSAFSGQKLTLRDWPLLADTAVHGDVDAVPERIGAIRLIGGIEQVKRRGGGAGR